MGEVRGWKRLIPHRRVEAVTDLYAAELQALGIRGVILDLDDTLVAQLDEEPTQEVLGWLAHMREEFQIFIVSNNWNGRRIKRIADKLEIPHLAAALKPRRRGFRKALAAMGLTARQVAVVGDQLFTDVLGGNRLGAMTILVTPLSVGERRLHRRWMRKAEAWTLDRLGLPVMRSERRTSG